MLLWGRLGRTDNQEWQVGEDIAKAEARRFPHSLVQKPLTALEVSTPNDSVYLYSSVPSFGLASKDKKRRNWPLALNLLIVEPQKNSGPSRVFR